jgi:hypothetical protein
MIKALILCIRIYEGILILYVISTWVSLAVHFPQWYATLITTLAAPVNFLFGWASFGSLGFGVVIALFLLDYLVRFLRRYDPDYQVRQAELLRQHEAARQDEAARLAAEHKPPTY